LPVCPIHDLIIKDSDLVVATHGRSFWILDDITPLRQAHDSIASSSAHLFEPRATKRYRVDSGFGNTPTPDYLNYLFTGPGYRSYRRIESPDGEKRDLLLDAGENPPDGVIFHYYLRDEPKEPVTLSILDAAGDVVNSYSSKPEDEKDTKIPAKAGANRFVWNMLYKGPEKLKEEGEGDIFAEFITSALSPKALPGVYTVKLEAGNQTLTQEFEILEDPRKPAPLQDLKAQFDLKRQIRDTVSELHTMLNELRDIRSEVDEWLERANMHGENRDISDAGLQVKTKLEMVENELVQLKASSPLSYDNRLKEKLTSLAFMIDEADAAPTFGSYEVYDDLQTRVATQSDLLKRIKKEDLPAFNRKVREAGIPGIVV
ncbi:MAG: glycosyl hydrolase, partial [Chloroflexota bacterium]